MKWINIEDRFPESGQYVLTLKIFLNESGWTDASYHIDRGYHINNDKFVWDDGGKTIYWRPLPEKPNKDDPENSPDTWAYELREHFNAFSRCCWEGFNSACEEMVRIGHENKINSLKWREYVLWDMQKKHDAELN